METDFPGVLRDLMPVYTSDTFAEAISATTVQLTWSGFQGGPRPREVQLRAKPKALPDWSILATGLSAQGGTMPITGLQDGESYEFQLLGYHNQGRLVAVGNVAEATTANI